MSIHSSSPQTEPISQTHEIADVQEVDCCIIGGGPAGAVLSLLLARQGIAVTLLEAHRDFDRDFRGDTLQPSAMEIMEEMGLADRLLELPHTKLRSITVRASDGSVIFSPTFTHLKTHFPSC